MVRNLLADLGVDGRIILEKFGMNALIAFIWLRTES
jgi:hypothetical protein